MQIPFDQILAVTDGMSEGLFGPRSSRAEIKTRPEDFVVEELPLYGCSGEGEHLYLWIEKRQISTGVVIQQLAERFQIHPRDIGYAGKKDAEAVSRQWLSVPAKAVNDAKAEFSDFRILATDRHQNKLRVGHLAGNRFIITLRNIVGQNSADLCHSYEQIGRDGFWNFFGNQRFGHRARGLDHAIKWALSGCRPSRDRRTSPEFLASVWQSAIFNWSMLKRIQAGLGPNLTPEDLPIYTTRKRAKAEGEPADCMVASGPMWGVKMRKARGLVGELESQALLDFGTLEMLDQLERWVPGERRPLISFVENLHTTVLSEASVQVEFSLQSGVFATSFLNSALPIVDVTATSA